MEFEVFSFRNAETIFENDERFCELWNEIKGVLKNITDEDIIDIFNRKSRKNTKSISDAINKLIDEKLVDLNWNRQSPIFNDSIYRPKGKNHWWTLDFAKETIAVEVAFNHGEATAWNLIKPVLSSELNHVEKAIQTESGIIITATDAMKKAGNFDSSCGTYEKFLQYLDPFRNILTVPLIIIGLKPPKTFIINRHSKSIERI
ncbi:BglII/BstYI family type II restriction endonuclease [Intestinibacter bartlettii]|uniref:BglII/BstYI family type II restriction endonuclease n=1 Tax=Intestinibacter bartlettii TaxID=261299 RepID=UPI0006BF16B6|nr:BglII/BstYI family type II restriction endonuclease [Intestinibacter bartlettii]CUP15238.1 Restriction endonuclease BglII [Intestinibacter bartlettii]